MKCHFFLQQSITTVNMIYEIHIYININIKCNNHSDQTNKQERDREIHHINKTMCFYFYKQRQLANQERVFESSEHHNAKQTFTSKNYQPSKSVPSFKNGSYIQ